MASSSGSHKHDSSNKAPSSVDGANGDPSNGITGRENCSGSSLKHNPGISIEWTSEEQGILEDCMNQFKGESNLQRYAKIAMQLPNKTVRDVAMRYRWLSKKEICKRRKDDNIAKKSKDKKERVNGSAANASNYAGQSSLSPNGGSLIPIDYDDGVSFKAIGGLTGELLAQNARAFSKVTANITTLEMLGKSQPIYESNPLIEENVALLSQIRDNINRIIIDMNEMPELMMKEMPSLPVKMSEDLSNAALLPPNAPPPPKHHLP